MSEKTANTLVLIMGGVLATLALIGKPATGPQRFKRLYGSFWLWLLLGVAADISPQLAGPFALLVTITAVAKDRGTLGHLIGATTPAPSAQPGVAAPAGILGPITHVPSPSHTSPSGHPVGG